MPPEIGPIGENRINKVQPINWTEKADLNERRFALPPEQPITSELVPPVRPPIKDLYVPSQELVPPLKIYQGTSEFLGNPVPVRPAIVSKAGVLEPISVQPKIEKPVVADPGANLEPISVQPKIEQAAIAPAAALDNVEPISVQPDVQQVAGKAVPTLAETATSDLQARRVKLMQAGTADSIIDLKSVNDELAKRGQFRSAWESAPDPIAQSEWTPGQSKTVKLTPEQLPPEVRTTLHSQSQPEIRPNTFSTFVGPLARATTYGLGALGVVGGLFQVNNGLDQVLGGQFGEGLVTTTAGICNTTAGGATFFAAMPSANLLAMRAGGLGAVLDGSMQLFKGYQSGNEVQLLDGGVRTSLGATMLSGGPTGWCAGSAYAGWSVGRFIGERKVAGDRTVDDIVTEKLYDWFFAS